MGYWVIRGLLGNSGVILCFIVLVCICIVIGCVVGVGVELWCGRAAGT